MVAHPRPAARREPRQQRSVAMVERIVAAGEAVLAERGYDGASTNHIAARAGISPGSLYQYFPNKAAILDQVLDRYADRLEARVSRAFVAALARSMSPESVRGVLVAMLDAFDENPRLLSALVEQLPRSEGGRRARFAHRIDELMATALAAGQPELSDASVEAVAWILVRAVEHVTIRYALDRPGFDRNLVLDELTALVVSYLDRHVPP